MLKRVAIASAVALIVAGIAFAIFGGGSGCQKDSQHRCTSFGAAPKGTTLRALPPSESTMEMFDSVDVLAPPASARAIAGYTSGNWPTFNGLVARFPNAYHVPISVSIFSPIERSGVPCVYANLSTMPSVRASIAAAGIPRSRYLLWVADWVYHPGIIPGYDAQQWSDHSFGNNDESTVTLHFLQTVGQCLDVEPGDATASEAGAWVKTHLAPIPKPQVKVAAYYVTHSFKLPAGQVASEHNTVLAWKKHSCVNPVRRPVCKSTHWHLELLAARAKFIATHHPVRGHWVPLTKPRWDFPNRQHPLGSRYAGMEHWLASRKNPCPTVQSCMP